MNFNNNFRAFIIREREKKKYFVIFVGVTIAILFYFYNNLNAGQSSSLLKRSADMTTDQEKSTSTSADLLLTPSTGNFYIGDTVRLKLIINTPNQSINALEGKIIFDPDQLEITSISKDASIINLWVQEPNFSNKEGVMTFTGVALAPGFIGPAGQILTILFKVNKTGHTMIKIDNALVLANDGFGTNVLTKTTPANLTLLKPAIKREIADFNNDGKIDLTDISILITNFGITKNPRFDLNGDGRIDIKDLSILLAN